mgnify:CR=1 FL=1
MNVSNAITSRREEYEAYYKAIPIKISKLYFNKFKVAVYPRVILRVSLDAVMGQQWDLNVERPAYKNLTDHELLQAIRYMPKLAKPSELGKAIKQSNEFRITGSIIDIKLLRQLKAAVERYNEKNK